MVYLLHFSEPVGNRNNPHGTAQHYIGYAKHSAEKRLKRHLSGGGSPLVHAAKRNGAEIVIARTWDGDRKLERKLKRQKNAPRFCPICKEVHNAQA